MRNREHHLTDEELLLALDRELPSRRLARVENHLTHCQACQARRAQIDRTARNVTAFYQRDPASHGEHGGYARERLKSKMNDLADRDGSRRVWAMAAAAAAAAVLLVRIAGPIHVFDSRDTAAAVEPGALPVASLTPGATWNLSAGELCAGGAREQPQIPVAVRQEVLRHYGMERVPDSEYELDYLITPELGGSPDPRNLWPERYASRVWNARVKDQLEQLLPQLVCDRQVPLETAQRDIARDWIAAYKKYFKTDVPLETRASLALDDEVDSP